MSVTKLRRIILRGLPLYITAVGREINGVFEVYIALSKIYYNCELDHFVSLKGRPPLPSANGVSDKFSILFSLYESISEFIRV